jgi:hypothetical protein
MLTGFIWPRRHRSSFPWLSWWAPAVGRTWLRTGSTPSVQRCVVAFDQCAHQLEVGLGIGVLTDCHRRPLETGELAVLVALDAGVPSEPGPLPGLGWVPPRSGRLPGQGSGDHPRDVPASPRSCCLVRVVSTGQRRLLHGRALQKFTEIDRAIVAARLCAGQGRRDGCEGRSPGVGVGVSRTGHTPTPKISAARLRIIGMRVCSRKPSGKPLVGAPDARYHPSTTRW